jgi:hypothetical protein
LTQVLYTEGIAPEADRLYAHIRKLNKPIFSLYSPFWAFLYKLPGSVSYIPDNSSVTHQGFDFNMRHSADGHDKGFIVSQRIYDLDYRGKVFLIIFTQRHDGTTHLRHVSSQFASVNPYEHNCSCPNSPDYFPRHAEKNPLDAAGKIPYIFFIWAQAENS